MQLDFTFDTYKKLLKGFIDNNYHFQTFSAYLRNPKDRVVILRHDVDRLPANSLEFARIQSDIGISGSYYFRSRKTGWDEEEIKQINNLGHEIGYHYENLSRVVKKLKSNHDTNQILNFGLKDFETQLTSLRQLVPVETICMHGAPTSRYDNKNLWGKYKYSDFKIIGEPYFDLDFSTVFYLTDTGRRWDGFNFSIRDKINGQQKYWQEKGMVFKSSFDLIDALNQNVLPPKIMITFHPQRWNHLNIDWCKELIFQNIKNPIKWALINLRQKKVLIP
ncbi:hypothetical protein [Labilibaculum manganireducens]|uniref:hypothetical protein n=1 Tax=Labilibaculum manganireducens TaxID=1940525 RepID=UPI0029F54E8A|nr:hypothetical protein [Labilibaculum manganireducens]